MVSFLIFILNSKRNREVGSWPSECLSIISADKAMVFTPKKKQGDRRIRREKKKAMFTEVVKLNQRVSLPLIMFGQFARSLIILG